MPNSESVNWFLEFPLLLERSERKEGCPDERCAVRTGWSFKNEKQNETEINPNAYAPLSKIHPCEKTQTSVFPNPSMTHPNDTIPGYQ